MSNDKDFTITPETLRQAADVHNATTIRMRAETSRRCFEGSLEYFVARYAPSSHDMRFRDEFQRDLMMLFRDAMEHKSMVYGMHIDRTETVLSQLSMAATSSAQVIFETEAHRQHREDAGSVHYTKEPSTMCTTDPKPYLSPKEVADHASRQLSIMLSQDLGVDVTPILLRLWLVERWDKVAEHAHKIHAGAA